VREYIQDIAGIKKYNNLSFDLLEVIMHKEFPEGAVASASAGVLYSTEAFYDLIIRTKTLLKELC
jgi:hypothetical protein